MKKRRLQRRASRFTKTNNNAAALPGDTTEIAVKRIVLDITGDFQSDPASLHDTLSLRDNLHFNDNDYSLLQIRLDKYVHDKKQEASVSTDEASSCETVGDCVTLAEGKLG